MFDVLLLDKQPSRTFALNIPSGLQSCLQHYEVVPLLLVEIDSQLDGAIIITNWTNSLPFDQITNYTLIESDAVSNIVVSITQRDSVGVLHHEDSDIATHLSQAIVTHNALQLCEHFTLQQLCEHFTLNIWRSYEFKDT